MEYGRPIARRGEHWWNAFLEGRGLSINKGRKVVTCGSSQVVVNCELTLIMACLCFSFFKVNKYNTNIYK